jgi:hypothetical protein
LSFTSGIEKRKSKRRIFSKGKNVTGFSNTEELPLTDVVPFLLKMLYKLTEQAIQKWKTGILMQLKTVC